MNVQYVLKFFKGMSCWSKIIFASFCVHTLKGIFIYLLGLFIYLSFMQLKTGNSFSGILGKRKKTQMELPVNPDRTLNDVYFTDEHN